MNKLIQTCQEKCGLSDVRDLLWVIAILLNFVVMLIFGLFSAQNFRNINTSYMFYFNIAMTTIFFYRFRDGLKKKRIYQIALIFAAWTVVCVFFNENHYIIADYFPQDLMMTLGTMCIALPFVDMTGDFDKKKCLEILMFALLVVLTLMVWLVVILTFMRTHFWLGDKEIGYILYDYWVGFPVLFGHQYFTAYFSVIGLFIGCFFMIKGRFKVLSVVGMIGFALAIALSKCRGAMLGLAVGIMVSGFLMIRSRNPQKKWIQCLPAFLKIVAGIVVGIFILWEVGSLWANYIAANPDVKPETAQVQTIDEKNDQNEQTQMIYPMYSTLFTHVVDAYKYDTQQRGFSLKTGSGRFKVYTKIPEMMKTGAPKSLLFGYNKTKVGDLYWDTFHLNYAHSSFIETLALLGIPGLLLALTISFCLWKWVFTLAFKKDFVPLSLENCLLPAFPTAFFTIGLVESLLFVNTYNTIPHYFYNLVFFLFLGYFAELMDRIKSGNTSGLL